jgi:hypothetical protein
MVDSVEGEVEDLEELDVGELVINVEDKAVEGVLELGPEENSSEECEEHDKGIEVLTVSREILVESTPLLHWLHIGVVHEVAGDG